MNKQTTKRRVQFGVTLVEVIFAMGVVLVGVLGVLSVIPLAGNRATDAVNLNTAAMLSDSVAKQVVASNLFVDEPTDSIAAGQLQPISALPLKVPSTSIPSTANFNPYTRPFCIDPLVAANTPTDGSTDDSYVAGYFPFFERNHDVLLDATDVDSTPTSVSGFDGQPRMLRVGPSDLASLVAVQAQQELSRLIAENPDDIDAYIPKDRSQPAILTGLTGTTGGISFGTKVPTGQFSWVITVDPFEDTNYASMSVVVMKNRERITEFPTAPASSTRNSAAAERVALVTDAIGFSGGSGGAVTLMSSGDTSSLIKSGDWLMLSTNADASNSGVHSVYHVHRWYRVVAVTEEPVLVTPTSNSVVDGLEVPACVNPASRPASTVWRRRVVLDGPDWSFQLPEFVTPPATPDPRRIPAPTAASTNSYTYATLVEGVVAVSERMISLSEF